MKSQLVTIALAVVLASPVAAQSSTAVQATNKVSPSLAASVKVTEDSAKALASAAADSGEVSSVDLQMKGKRLVYEVKVLNKSKRASEVTVDAMSGEIVENEQYGGLKSTMVHNKENKKLLNAKRDSAKTTP